MYLKPKIRGGDDMEYILQTNHLSKVYGAKTVLNQVSIHVPKGLVFLAINQPIMLSSPHPALFRNRYTVFSE